MTAFAQTTSTAQASALLQSINLVGRVIELVDDTSAEQPDTNQDDNSNQNDDDDVLRHALAAFILQNRCTL